MIDPRIRDEATRWFLSRQSGDADDEDASAFAAWLAGHPDASVAYRQAEQVWDVAGDLQDDAVIAASRSANSERYRRPGFPRRWALAGIAACAALAVAALPGPVATYLDTQLAPLRGGGQVLRTGTRHGASSRLPDGTIVTMDVGTQLRVLEMGARRRVELAAGHAFFKVAKDPAHPFLVTAGTKTVHAIGTAFDVRIEPDGVAVTLVEGKVRVDQSRGLLRDPIATDMTPGKQLVAADDQVWMMTPVDTAATTAWLADRVTYLPETVGRIVADVNRGSPRQIVFRAPIDQEQRIVGVFQRGDVEAVATVLEMQGIARVAARSATRIEMQPIARQ